VIHATAGARHPLFPSIRHETDKTCNQLLLKALKPISAPAAHALDLGFCLRVGVNLANAIGPPEAPSFISGCRFGTRKCHESSTALVLTLQHAIDLTHLFGGQWPMVQGPAVIFDLRDGSETWDR
jgi:hypothetical protein